MAKFSSYLSVCCLFISAFMVVSVTVNGSGLQELRWASTTAASGRCRGTVAECMVQSEFDMESEINRRILATSQYISYQALQRNTVPCSQRGQSYYNCQQSGQANPYNRGCSALARCRS